MDHGILGSVVPSHYGSLVVYIGGCESLVGAGRLEPLHCSGLPTGCAPVVISIGTFNEHPSFVLDPDGIDFLSKVNNGIAIGSNWGGRRCSRWVRRRRWSSVR